MADETKRFREKLDALSALAKKNQMKLTVQEVQEILEGEKLPDEKMQLVYSYLDQMSIEVYDPQIEEKPSDEKERKTALDLYLEELDRFTPLPEDVELMLFEKAAGKDRQASDMLIERYLSTVCDLASEFEKESDRIDAEDLVQEANTGLVMAVAAIEKEESLAAYRVKLLNYVTTYLEDSVKELKEMMNADSRIVNRMNKLADAARSLEEELGHKPSIGELSAFLELPEEDIKDLLRVGGENLKVEEL